MINTNQTPNASNLRNSIYYSTSYKFEEITLPETLEPKPFLNIIQNVINLLSNLMTKTEILSQTESSSILNNDVKTIQSLLTNSSYALWMSKFIPNFKEQEHLISLLMELVNNRASLESIKLLQNSCCSYDTKFQRLSHLVIVIACTKVQQNPDTINILHNSSEFILLNLLHMLEPADITIIAQCKYLAYKSTKKLVLLKEAFMLSHYANIVDPISAETVMITIGEEIIEIYRKFPESLETNFIEFVSRRVSTSNIGAMNKSFFDFYSNAMKTLKSPTNMSI